jgi:hypothetical protein
MPMILQSFQIQQFKPLKFKYFPAKNVLPLCRVFVSDAGATTLSTMTLGVMGKIAILIVMCFIATIIISDKRHIEL